MGRKCSVKGCTSDSQRTEDLGVTFHKVPFHVDIRPKWLQLCQITDEKKVIYVCSRHFLRADFCNFKGKKYMLKQGVLPSIFAWNKPKPIPESATPGFEEVVVKIENEVVVKIEDESDFTQIIKSEFANVCNDVNEIIESNLMQPLHIKTDPLEIKEDLSGSPTNSSTIEQKINTVCTSTGELTFVPTTRIEALDFNQKWSPATILEVDYEENEVLVHFDMYSSKYDEWIGINSNSIRALTNRGTKKSVYEYREGERCMASWSDARKFPATVSKVIDCKTYEVLFDDGYVKTLKSHRMSKSSATSPQCSPLFQPVRGTKEDRRNRKRKLNVSTLFAKKRLRAGSQEISIDEKSVEPIQDILPIDAKVENLEDWIPRWENNYPVGIASYVSMSEGHRKSIIVPDPRLPPKWEKHMTQRPFGNSAGKWDSIIVSPEGRKFRQRADIRQYVKENPHLNLKESMFDFMIHKKRKKPAPPAEPVYDRIVPEHAVKYVPPPPPIVNRNQNALKIMQVDGGYKCPIEGCEKNFRRENLTQMHVKHYHPQYSKFLDCTPNVADLAYARTVGESLDKSPVPRDFRSNRLKTMTPRNRVLPDYQQETASIDSHKDSEIIKLLNSKPFDAIKSMDSSSVQPLPSGLPASMYPDIKLKDLLVKSEAVPKNSDINLKSLSSATSRPTGLKTILPVKKDEDMDPKLTPTRPSGRKDAKRKRLVSEVLDMQRNKDAKQELAAPGIQPLDIIKTEPLPEPVENTIIEGGEVIKIVRMKREEIINCTCGITEEDGLMIQCELCLCWQHAYCNNIQKEIEVPEKYICYICQHPVRQRNSKKYMHDQDWLKYGSLPTGSYHCKDEAAQTKKFEKLKKSHDISGGLVELKGFMHSLKRKIKVAEVNNHPKLYLWSKPWEKLPLPEKQEVKIEPKAESSSEEYNVKSEDSQNASMLLSILKSGKDDIKIKDEIPDFPKIDINSLIENNLETITTPNVPQPEAAIESADCRLNLLEHISHCEDLVEERLNDYERQIDELDLTFIFNNDENYTRVRHTTSMLLRDLNTLKEFSEI